MDGKTTIELMTTDLKKASAEMPPLPAASEILPGSGDARDTEINTAPQEGVAVRIPTWRVVILLISLCCGLFLSLLDTSIVATAIYSIGEDFDQLGSVTWVALAYTLSYVGCAVLFARLSDVTGRRNAYVGAFVIFIAFSIGCGFANSLEQLIACRALQGIGGSGLYSLTMVMFPEISPSKLLQLIGSMAGMVVAISGVLGPVLGGLITHYSTWRWIFWMNAPIGIVPLALFYLAWPPAIQMKHIERRPLRELDFIGALLLTSASVLVVFSFQEGGLGASGDVWHTAAFLAPLLVGCALWILLFGWEATVQRLLSIPPLLPPQLLRKRVFTAGVITTIMTGFVYFIVIYSLPLHFQIVYRKSALLAGVGLLPMLGSAAVGSMLGGMLNGKKNRTFPILVIAACFMAVGTGLLSTLSSLHLEPKVYGFQALVGFGFGLTVSNVTLLAVLHSQPKDHAVAQGIMAQARVFGGSIGIAASTAILGVIQRREIGGIPHRTSSSSSSPASAHAYQAVQQAYADAFLETMRVTAIIASVSFLLCLMTFERYPTTMRAGK